MKTDQARDVHSGEVFGLHGNSGDFLGQWRQALINMNAALSAQGAMPPHLRQVAVNLRDVTDWDRDPVARDLLFREVLGGNIPEFVVSAKCDFDEDAVLVSVDGLSVVTAVDADEIIYRDFNRAQLNREYSARAAVPEHLDIFAQWRERGLRFRDRRSTEIDYGNSALEKIDLYLPESVNDSVPPLHIFIHGGYWQAMDKMDHGFLLEALLDAGAAVALINYTLCPDISIAGIVGQCQRSLAVLHQQADHWGYDASRVHLSGHSAGGHLGAMMAATDWPSVDETMPRDFVKSATLVSGLFDLDPLRFTGMNRALQLTAETALANSPVHLLPGHDLPVFLAVGGEESTEFHRQSALLHQAWTGKVDLAWIDMPGRNHFTVIEGLNQPDNALFHAVRDVMEL